MSSPAPYYPPSFWVRGERGQQAPQEPGWPRRPMPAPQPAPPRGFIPVVRRWWWLLVTTALIAGATGFFVSSGAPPSYAASVKLLVGPINPDIDQLRVAEAQTQTYAELATSQPVIQATARQVNVAPGSLETAVTATANDITRLLTVTVHAAEPERAARIANALGAQLIELADTPPGNDAQPGRALQVIEEATPPSAPVEPQVALIVLLAATAGLIGALVLALLLEYGSDAIRSERDVAEVVPAPFLGTVEVPRKRDDIVSGKPSRASAGYRLLATTLELTDRDRQRESVLVLGSDPAATGDVALNLAAVLAQIGVRVVLIDGDGEASSVTGLPRLQPAAVGADQSADGDRIRAIPMSLPGLAVLPGQAAPEMLKAETARRLLERALDDAEVVIVTAPPVDRSPTALVWARVCDATVVVARLDRTKRAAIGTTMENLGLVGANVAGAVLARRHS